jgi:hypothetical protein
MTQPFLKMRHSTADIPSYFVYLEMVLYIYNVLLIWKDRSPSCAVRNGSCISDKPDEGSQLQPNHITVNKIYKTRIAFDWFKTYIFKDSKLFQKWKEE